KGLARPILDELEIRLPGKTPDLKGILVENDNEFAAPFNPAAVFSTKFLKGKERLEWLRFVLRINRIDPQKLNGESFGQWIRQTGYSPNVQSLLLLLGKLATYCDAPE